MLRLCRAAVLVVGSVVLVAGGPGRRVAAQVVQGTVPAQDVLRVLAGGWRAQEYKVPVSTDLDVSVWGKGASKVRNVELALEPDGDGILRVHLSVVDRRGRVKPYSASVIEARLRLEPSAGAGTLPVEPRVTVVSADERYLDDSGNRRTIDGLKVKINAMSADSRELNVRFDTAQGFGSFGETLVRQSRAATTRTTRG